MIDCLKQELCEEKQKRLKMEYDLKILKDKLLNVGGHIKINNELKNDIFDNNIFTLGELHAPEEICVDDSLENLPTFAKPARQKQTEIFDRDIQTNSEPENDHLDNENFTLGEEPLAPEATCIDDSLENLHPIVQPVGHKQLRNEATNVDKDARLAGQMRVPSKSPEPLIRAKEINTRNCQNSTRILSKIPEWMGCLPLINLPKPLEKNTSNGASMNSRGTKKNNNNY